jgi:hypothetical protein
MKLVKRALLAVLLLACAGLAAGWFFLDPLVGSAIEKGSTYATGVETRVGGVDASFFSGRFGIRDLSLANPPGFRPEPFVRLASARATWQSGSILSDTIQMDELLLDGVELNLERVGSGTNYGKILANLEKLSSGDKGNTAASQGGRQLAIRKIEIRNVRAGLRLSGVPLASGSMEVEAPSIVIDDFRSDGSTTEIVARLTRAVLQAILENVLSAGKDIFPADLAKDLGRGLAGLKGAVGGGAKDVLHGLEGALKGAGGILKK